MRDNGNHIEAFQNPTEYMSSNTGCVRHKLYSNGSSRTSNHDSRGYVLFDVLMAIFLFGIGFAALAGLTESYLRETRQASNFTEAVNIAQKNLEFLAGHKWDENIAQGRCIPGSVVQGDEGRFHWSISCEWDTLPDLLQVSVRVDWFEERQMKNYLLETAYHVE